MVSRAGTGGSNFKLLNTRIRGQWNLSFTVCQGVCSDAREQRNVTMSCRHLNKQHASERMIKDRCDSHVLTIFNAIVAPRRKVLACKSLDSSDHSQPTAETCFRWR